MIDGGIFTAPPRFEHSGAALLDADGKLVGIGSLWVSDALEIGAAFPGNMFVPIDLLKPLLDDLLANGRLGVGGDPVGHQSEFYQRLWSSGDAGSSVVLHVLHKRSVRQLTVQSMDRM